MRKSHDQSQPEYGARPASPVATPMSDTMIYSECLTTLMDTSAQIRPQAKDLKLKIQSSTNLESLKIYFENIILRVFLKYSGFLTS